MMKFLFAALMLAFTAISVPVSAPPDASRVIWFGTTLPAGAYRAWIRTDSGNGCAMFMVTR